MRFGFYLLFVFLVVAFLCDFLDVDFGVEVGGKGFVMVVCVVVYNIEVVYFIKVVFSGMGGEDVCYVGVKIIV